MSVRGALSSAYATACTLCSFLFCFDYRRTGDTWLTFCRQAGRLTVNTVDYRPWLLLEGDTCYFWLLWRNVGFDGDGWMGHWGVSLRRVQSYVTELNWLSLVFDKLTIGQAGRAHWSLVDVYVSVVTYLPTPLDGAYCNALLLAYWSIGQKLNHASSVQLRQPFGWAT